MLLNLIAAVEVKLLLNELCRCSWCCRDRFDLKWRAWALGGDGGSEGGSVCCEGPWPPQRR